jgi:hypothetical protein
MREQLQAAFPRRFSLPLSVTTMSLPRLEFRRASARNNWLTPNRLRQVAVVRHRHQYGRLIAERVALSTSKPIDEMRAEKKGQRPGKSSQLLSARDGNQEKALALRQVNILSS